MGCLSSARALQRAVATAKAATEKRMPSEAVFGKAKQCRGETSQFRIQLLLQTSAYSGEAASWTAPAEECDIAYRRQRLSRRRCHLYCETPEVCTPSQLSCEDHSQMIVGLTACCMEDAARASVRDEQSHARASTNVLSRPGTVVPRSPFRGADMAKGRSNDIGRHEGGERTVGVNESNEKPFTRNSRAHHDGRPEA
ncbi:hypothetical protein SMMN14_05021 [Sphaerulina musiva]